MEFDHPFAAYVRILGRGRKLSRSLTMAEAEDAMAMILKGAVLPEQLGAFMMLLRVKEETPEEIAGFVRAARASFALPDPAPQADLDWSSYAGKRRQLPWFLLAALLLSQNGVRLFMHGTEGHTPGRLYTREVLEALSLPVARSLAEAGRHLAARNFAYLPLEHLSAILHHIIELRPILGLRSPVHTVARLLNPLGAPCILQGIFHRAYMETHQLAAQLLGEEHMAVFRGEGGEIECRPNKSFEVRSLEEGVSSRELWSPLLPESPQPVDEDMAVDRLLSIWRGETQDDYALAAVIGTVAIACKALGRAGTCAQARDAAKAMWRARDKERLAA